MALTAPALASLVYADHLAAFPDSTRSTRSNPATGVPLHNILEAFISALCEGIVSAVLTAVVQDAVTGTDDQPGSTTPVPFTLPSTPVALATFLTSQGWAGESAELAANSLVVSPMTHLTTLARIQMADSTVVGAGTGLVSPSSNPNLVAALQASLSATLPAAFKAAGKFAKDDIPGGHVNDGLLQQLPAYATAYATAIGSVTAVTTYIGTGATAGSADGTVLGAFV